MFFNDSKLVEYGGDIALCKLWYKKIYEKLYEKMIKDNGFFYNDIVEFSIIPTDMHFIYWFKKKHEKGYIKIVLFNLFQIISIICASKL